MDTATYKEKLESELKKLQEELASVGVQNPENPSDWEAKETQMDTTTPMADPNESADKIEEYTQNRAINDTLEIRYNDVKHALDKIAQGQYGICEVGGEPIEEDRLEADPAARTCKAHM